MKVGFKECICLKKWLKLLQLKFCLLILRSFNILNKSCLWFKTFWIKIKILFYLIENTTKVRELDNQMLLMINKMEINRIN